MQKTDTTMITQRHVVLNDFSTVEFEINAIKGLTEYPAEYNGVKRIVEIRAYRITLKETCHWTYPYKGGKMRRYPFGYITARSYELNELFKCIKDECKTLEQIKSAVHRLRNDASVALRKDANRALRRELNLEKKYGPAFDRTKLRSRSPLPHNKMYWEEKDRSSTR